MYGDQNRPSAEDPIMISPKGHEVQIPKARVNELLKKGFTFKDTELEEIVEDASAKQPKEPVIHGVGVPLPKKEIEKQIAKDVDTLEIVEV